MSAGGKLKKLRSSLRKERKLRKAAEAEAKELQYAVWDLESSIRGIEEHHAWLDEQRKYTLDSFMAKPIAPEKGLREALLQAGLAEMRIKELEKKLRSCMRFLPVSVTTELEAWLAATNSPPVSPERRANKRRQTGPSTKGEGQ